MLWCALLFHHCCSMRMIIFCAELCKCIFFLPTLITGKISCFSSSCPSISLSLWLHQRVKNCPKCSEIMAKPSYKLRNEAQIPPESTCDVLRNSSRALLSYAIHEIFFFWLLGKCPVFQWITQCFLIILFMQRTIQHVTDLCMLHKNFSEQRISEGLFSHNSQGRWWDFFSIQCIWLLVLSGSVNLEKKEMVILLCMC